MLGEGDQEIELHASQGERPPLPEGDAAKAVDRTVISFASLTAAWALSVRIAAAMAPPSSRTCRGGGRPGMSAGLHGDGSARAAGVGEPALPAGRYW